MSSDASTVRRSSRPTKIPGWLNDFIYGATKSTATSPSYHNSLCNLSSVKEIESLAEALQDPKWLDAIDQELKALNDNQIWALVDLPSDERAN